MTSREHQPLEKLPERLLVRAERLGNELAWPADAVREVIDWFRNANVAIVGVELWHEDHGAPKWISSSAYQCERSTDWHSYLECCATGALAFVDWSKQDPDALFNLTWIEGTDAAGQ